MVSTDTHRLRELITTWGKLWGLPELERTVALTFSRRLKRSLGRCRPATGRIAIQARLADDDPELLAEVLCHEAAHIAAYQLFDSVDDPHGERWRELVRRAGYEPSARHTTQVDAPAMAAGTIGRYTHEHRCPVCHSVRYARRSVPTWRCAECTDAGLSGKLTITRVKP
jgi:predicted SprT family Zn-dependent metalloprotease